MMNYQRLDEIVTKARKLPKTIENKTTIRKLDDGTIAIQHHATDIVLAKPNGSFTLNTGGWMSLTTKERLNRYSPARIFQERGLFWISYDGEKFPFKDGIVVKANGKPARALDAKKTEDAAKKVSRMISKYIRGFCEDIQKNGLEAPGGGDCWLCLMKTNDGKTLGETGDDAAHVLGHMTESYYVPSLLLNAAIERRVNAMRAGDPAVAKEQARRDFWYVTRSSDPGWAAWAARSAARQARVMLRHFFRKRRHLLVAALGG